jgi:hypothetical protein
MLRVRGEELERDRAIEDAVVAEIDVPHSSLTERADDLEAVDFSRWRPRDAHRALLLPISIVPQSPSEKLVVRRFAGVGARSIISAGGGWG